MKYTSNATYRPSADDYAAKGNDKGTLGTAKPSQTPRLVVCVDRPCIVCESR